MRLHQSQAEIAKNRTRFRVVCCGRRFGKTTLAIEEIKGLALYKQSIIAYIAPTYQQARDIAWATLIKELQPIIKKQNESRLELTVYNNIGGESVIQLRGWESVETLRGQHFDMVIIDEVASMRNFWLHWQEVIRPTLTDRRGNGMFISTPKGFNHFYDLYNLENDPIKGKDYKSFHFTSYDNPHIPEDEIKKAKQEITEDRFAQEYLADFRKTEGLVYKEFNREIHLINEIPKGFIKKIAGLDFGYTNPAAIVIIGIDYDNNYWVIGEWYKTQQTNEQIAQAAQIMQLNEIYPDPERPEGIEVLRRFKLNVREVVKGHDSVEAGIQKVRELFKQNKIRIHKDCKNLIWELETYRYEEKQPDKNIKEVPVKENDHAVDALRYALYTVGISKPQRKRKERPRIDPAIKLRMTNY